LNTCKRGDCMKEWLKLFLKKYLIDWVKKIFCKVVCRDECELEKKGGDKK